MKGWKVWWKVGWDPFDSMGIWIKIPKVCGVFTCVFGNEKAELPLPLVYHCFWASRQEFPLYRCYAHRGSVRQMLLACGDAPQHPANLKQRAADEGPADERWPKLLRQEWRWRDGVSILPKGCDGGSAGRLLGPILLMLLLDIMTLACFAQFVTFCHSLNLCYLVS